MSEQLESKTPSDAAACWADLAPNDRNALVARAIKDELLGQWYLAFDGRPYHPLPHPRGHKEEADKVLAVVRSREFWKEHSRDHRLPADGREKVSLKLVEWPLRYSDTPGGGWVVVEAIRAAGYAVQIATCRGGWRVTVIVGPDPVSMVAETMAEAACQVALLVLPNKELSQPPSVDNTRAS